jgi:hypothetical protein
MQKNKTKRKMTTKEATDKLGITQRALYTLINENRDNLQLKRVRGKNFLMLDITEEQYAFFENKLNTKNLIIERKTDFIQENMQDILDDSKRDSVSLRYAKIFGVQEMTAKSRLNKIAYEEKLKTWRQDDTRTNFKQECEND